jgi:hypothetical protein
VNIYVPVVWKRPLRDILTDIEWGWLSANTVSSEDRCPYCHRIREIGHGKECQLAAAIRLLTDLEKA